MKVIFVSSGNNRFGITPFIKSQGNSLIKAGVEIEYFLIQGKGLTGYARAVLKLRHWLKKNPVDLLHAHYGLCGWVAYLAKPNKIPLVISYMGSDIFPVKRQRISKKALIARLSRAVQNRADHIIVKSEILKNELNRKTDISVIPNGVDINQFKPLLKEDCRKRLELEIDIKIVLFLGNPKDGVKNIQLAKNVVTSLSSLDLILLSPFPIKPEQVLLYFNAADVLVLPSISEGSPNVVKEAMACNCPIVATDVGDVRWVIGDTPGCFLTSFSAKDVALKIKSALDLKKRTTGRDRIIKLGLDSVSIAKRIITVYETVLKKSN